ncbi:MAG: hypothetical protein ACREBU_17430, partial [Nitrososphaera sp.]
SRVVVMVVNSGRFRLNDMTNDILRFVITSAWRDVRSVAIFVHIYCVRHAYGNSNHSKNYQENHEFSVTVHEISCLPHFLPRLRSYYSASVAKRCRMF